MSMAMVGKHWVFCFVGYLLLLQVKFEEAIADQMGTSSPTSAVTHESLRVEGQQKAAMEMALQGFCFSASSTKSNFVLNISMADSTLAITSRKTHEALKLWINLDSGVDKTTKMGVSAGNKSMQVLSYDHINGIYISGFSISVFQAIVNNPSYLWSYQLVPFNNLPYPWLYPLVSFNNLSYSWSYQLVLFTNLSYPSLYPLVPFSNLSNPWSYPLVPFSNLSYPWSYTLVPFSNLSYPWSYSLVPFSNLSYPWSYQLVSFSNLSYPWSYPSIPFNNLSYPWSYPLVPFNGFYDGFVEQVYSMGRCWVAAVGNVERYAYRLRYVDFSKPYFQSGLLMKVGVDGLSSEPEPFIGLLIISGSIAAVVLLYCIVKLVAIWLANLQIQPNGQVDSKITVEMMAVSVGQETEILPKDDIVPNDV